MTEVPTSERLARDLEALDDPRLAGMIQRAHDGLYDDFKSPLETPIQTLVNELNGLGYRQMADRARNGEWDATAAEGDDYFANDPEGQATMAELRRDGVDVDRLFRRDEGL